MMQIIKGVRDSLPAHRLSRALQDKVWIISDLVLNDDLKHPDKDE